jgi:hypothetical protein
MNVRRYLLPTLVVLFAATLWVGCDKDDDDDKIVNNYTLTGPASGTQERPNPVTTAATGTITGDYEKDTKMLHYTITWSNLTGAPAAMHFHGPAVPDSAAGVQVPITNFPTEVSGTVTGMATLTGEQETQLLSGLWYYNIHTAQYPGGEIRGNITVTAED